MDCRGDDDGSGERGGACASGDGGGCSCDRDGVRGDQISSGADLGVVVTALARGDRGGDGASLPPLAMRLSAAMSGWSRFRPRVTRGSDGEAAGLCNSSSNFSASPNRLLR